MENEACATFWAVTRSRLATDVSEGPLPKGNGCFYLTVCVVKINEIGYTRKIVGIEIGLCIYKSFQT
jgi:hypothetical protein